ncbi:hypothetical protein [Photobacterium carnosum]|uniref:hypothetical protein n=1 Tax=Photobacterium carnosum TaxID=2023717 RepID=UPI001E2D6607|nr:hypothetical protein [Photobacterium carnosum]MCD9494943.1 hypothetical protein [Photobacterium carnosum]
MKIKLISTIIAGILLAGCGSDDDTPPTQKATVVYAYDGPVNGLAATYHCDNGETGTTQNVTDGYGAVTIYNDTFAEHPESCSLTLKVPKKGQAFDMLNNKEMSNVEYTIPQGYLTNNQRITASPLTTLLDKAVNESGETNRENIDFDAIIEEIFLALNIDPGIVVPSELMNDPKNTLIALAKTAVNQEDIALDIAQDITTQIMVLSDVLTSQVNPTTKNSPKIINTIIDATNNLSAAIQRDNEFFPNKEFNKTDEPIYVDFVEDLKQPNVLDDIAKNIIPDDIKKDIETPKDGVKQDPINPPVEPTPPTPGTGGGDGGITD